MICTWLQMCRDLRPAADLVDHLNNNISPPTAGVCCRNRKRVRTWICDGGQSSDYSRIYASSIHSIRDRKHSGARRLKRKRSDWGMVTPAAKLTVLVAEVMPVTVRSLLV